MRAPDFGRGEYPSGGERIGPAWEVMWAALGTGQWMTNRDLAGWTKAWIVEKTTANLASQAKRAGLLQSRKVGRVKQYRRKDVQP